MGAFHLKSREVHFSFLGLLFPTVFWKRKQYFFLMNIDHTCSLSKQGLLVAFELHLTFAFVKNEIHPLQFFYVFTRVIASCLSRWKCIKRLSKSKISRPEPSVQVADYYQIGNLLGSGGSRRGDLGHGLPLILRPNWGQKGRKKCFWRPVPPPHYLRVWMRAPPLPLSQGLDPEQGRI